ncbi:EAL and HDOD domain-containing protein [Pseudoalteromonas denitrificans]|uniref:EAL and modified HD-GYP domain-containing signal transduction protein n=1 Tax=Pseudoalteromonas denitrificans DSM 6059 TaxID=1123010 RepID=A0A1I1J4V9_9GAMM|nr:HDOD domain-containing protein [Pseudoalteromonas denitrificans]SFC43659.1 EAL and modified HD-GYP domain-containing signal transduction protein [Pseudoalteromonas denitrificans DSM 6059]
MGKTKNKMVTDGVQFVARQPIFDNQKEIFAYELLYRDSEANFFPQHLTDEQATGRMFFDAILLHGLNKLTNNHTAFINLSTSALILELPNLISADQAVIEIIERTEELEEVTHFVSDMKKQGYTFALDDYDGDEKWEAVLEQVDYIKLEVEEPIMRTILQAKKLKRKYPKTKIVVERIEDYVTFKQLSDAGVDYFQGYFFSKPEMMSLKNINPTKMIVLELLKLASKPDLNFMLVQEKVAKDLSLTARVLKLANSACGNSNILISSLTQAIVYLGEDLIRQFISVLALSELGQDKPSELTKLGLLRAQFLTLMLEQYDTKIINTGYLVGLVSVLDAVLDCDMAGIVADFKLSKACKDALLNDEGIIGKMLYICKAIELDDWVKIQGQLKKGDVNANKLALAYTQALFYADETLDEINEEQF